MGYLNSFQNGERFGATPRYQRILVGDSLKISVDDSGAGL